MNKQLKPSFAILLICNIYGTLPIGEQDVLAPVWYENLSGVVIRQDKSRH